MVNSHMYHTSDVWTFSIFFIGIQTVYDEMLKIAKFGFGSQRTFLFVPLTACDLWEFYEIL